MAKSQIIKDLANGKVDLHTSLKRTKVILQEIGNNDINDWINNEIEGYKNIEDIPEYRKVRGILRGSFIDGVLNRCNVAIPLNNVDNDDVEALVVNSSKQSVYALQQAISSNHSFERKLTHQECAYLSKKTGYGIYDAYAQTDSSAVMNILSQIENKLLDILMCLEKEFGNLDELDINIESKSENDLKRIVNYICVIINNDKSVTIGNNNEFNNSNIASSIKNES